MTINSATLSGADFTMSGASFPVTLAAGLAVTLDIQFTPKAAGAASGTLTISSNSSTGASSVLTLNGTGLHQVTLTWSPPSSSPVPVEGYNIYRATGTSAAYQKLNSSPDVQTTYLDTTVQAGVTYLYEVRSVDSAGVESTSSKSTTAVVP